jgi:hypothetical protein
MPIDGEYSPSRDLTILSSPTEKPTALKVELSDSHYYCGWNGALRDFLTAAQSSADINNRRQQIHCHAYIDSCEGQEHFFIDPDPRRSKAVGGQAR